MGANPSNAAKIEKPVMLATNVGYIASASMSSR